MDHYSITEYVTALSSLSLTETWKRMLQIHHSAPERDITASEMARGMGWADHGSANMHYGGLAHLLWDHLRRLKQPTYWVSLLAMVQDDGRELHWIMRPELASALEQLGLVASHSPRGREDKSGFAPEPRRTEYAPTKNEPSHPDYSAPGRAQTIVSRIIRDTSLTRTLKEEFDWRCQVCGTQICLLDGKMYAEAHHIIPLGGDHNGLDVRENILILCPNHHAEFDYGAIAVDPESMRIIHVNQGNPYHMRPLAYERADLSKASLEYHYLELFGIRAR